MSGFFNDIDSEEWVDPQSVQLAKKLANVVKSKRLQTAAIDVTKWAADFERLLHEEDAEIVADTLDWFLERIGQQYVPQAYSADGFRKKFRQIRKLQEDDPVGVRVSDEARKLADELLQDEWPAGLDRNLANVVQKSLDRYAVTHAKLKAFRSRLPELTRAAEGRDAKRHKLLRLYACFLDHLFDSFTLCKPRDFVDAWLRRLRDIVLHWKGWSGSASSLAYSEDSPWLRKFGRGWSVDYFGGHSFYWDDLFKEVCNGEQPSDVQDRPRRVRTD